LIISYHICGMKTASVSQIKQELQALPPAQVLEICLRLAKSKKENKELLSFLLFNSEDLTGYIEDIKEELDESFKGIQKLSFYLAKKSLRKILKNINKYIKHAQSATVEIEVLIHFCKLMIHNGLMQYKASVITNIYQQQLVKLNKAISTLHEDLQYEYRSITDELSIPSIYR
jgi:hypothetical protein